MSSGRKILSSKRRSSEVLILHLAKETSICLIVLLFSWITCESAVVDFEENFVSLKSAEIFCSFRPSDYSYPAILQVVKIWINLISTCSGQSQAKRSSTREFIFPIRYPALSSRRSVSFRISPSPSSTINSPTRSPPSPSAELVRFKNDRIELSPSKTISSRSPKSGSLVCSGCIN